MARPDGEEEAAQITGFSAVSGHVGYLREAYHGEPYATRVLVPEAFEESAADGVPIPAARLRERLPQALQTAIERERQLYGDASASESSPPVKSFADFVALCERMEAETGAPCMIIASW